MCVLKKECALEIAIATDSPHKQKFRQVETLIKLYSQAIEFFQNTGSDLHLDMIIRMQTMLVKPEILKILNEELNKQQEEQKQPENELLLEDDEVLSSKLRKIWKIPTPMSKKNTTKVAFSSEKSKYKNSFI